jgi:ATP phosphoribosyltransferase
VNHLSATPAVSAVTPAHGDKLIIAAPSKGRLQENAFAFFARAGLELQQARGAREYRGQLRGVEGAEALFLSASEITARLGCGDVHLGVTGEDLVREEIADADARVELLAPLGFGAANVVVAVPQAWIDVRDMADLADVAGGFRARHGRGLRVATKYVNTTRRFFAQHHIGDYRIVESSGATEGAPAAGVADLIVDITTTGATLTANALKVLDDGVILRSQANLVASLKAHWSVAAREAARVILSRIAAEEEARTTREVRAKLSEASEETLRQAEIKFGATLCERRAAEVLSFSAPAEQVTRFADWLISQGAQTVACSRLDYVFHAENALWRRLEARLPSDKIAASP